MKIKCSMKKAGVLIALLAVLGLAAPGYAWTHDDGFGRGHYSGNYYRGGYGHGPWHHHGWGRGYYYPGGYYRYHRPYYAEAPYYYGPGFGISIPGFSFYVGP